MGCGASSEQVEARQEEPAQEPAPLKQQGNKAVAIISQNEGAASSSANANAASGEYQGSKMPINETARMETMHQLAILDTVSRFVLGRI
jgi:hypothetical protein